MYFIPEEDSVSLFDGDNVIIFPLLKEEIELLKNDKNYFENYINLKYDADFEFDENGYMQKQYELFKNSRAKLPWLSIWMIVSAKDKSIIGTINFKNSPSKDKIIEVGFFINPSYRNQNYATVALNLISRWAFDNGIKKITAQTEKNNIASQKVLKKNNFLLSSEQENNLYYSKKNDLKL